MGDYEAYNYDDSFDRGLGLSFDSEETINSFMQELRTLLDKYPGIKFVANDEIDVIYRSGRITSTRELYPYG